MPKSRMDVFGGIGYLLDESRVGNVARKVTEHAEFLPLSITRAELFITSGCNLECAYCRSIDHDMPPWEDKQVLLLLERLSETGTKHIQWTGGEPTTHHHLVDFVAYSTNTNMANSISTNGAADTETYRQLVAAGVQRFYVSLDSIQSEDFDRVTKSRGNMTRVMGNILSLRDCKNSAGIPHICVNTVLDGSILKTLMADGESELKRLLRWCVKSGVDDFKFLPVSTLRLEHAFPHADCLARFVAICSSEVPERYKMFHHRLRQIQRGAHGFHDDQHRVCYQSLDDRAFDSIGAYPCIIQLREGGKRLYNHGDTDDVKKQRLHDFLVEDRSRDAICRSFCFDLYRDLNMRVSRRLASGSPRGSE